MTSCTRGLTDRVVQLMGHVPCVILEGARAVGKTTLLKQLLEQGVVRQYVDLTDPDTRRWAQQSPKDFVRQLKTPVAIDEAQLVPELTLAVKQRIDAEHGCAGMFILSGSRRLGRGALGGADPLVGRAVRVRLRSLVTSEIQGSPLNRSAEISAGNYETGPVKTGTNPTARTLTGGYPLMPGVLSPANPDVAQTLVAQYVEGILHRDLLHERVDKAKLLVTLRTLLAEPSGILNVQKLASRLNFNKATIENHLALLEEVFLLDRVPMLAGDGGREAKAHPRIVPADTMLTVWAERLDQEALHRRTDISGGLLHALVTQELTAQLEWGDRGRVLHFRNGTCEADLVVAFTDGTLVPVEVKSKSTVGNRDIAQLRRFLARFPAATHGVVFYTGNDVLRLEEGIWALPVAWLWSDGSMADRRTTTPVGGTAATLRVIRSARDVLNTHGRLDEVVEDVCRHYEFLTGVPVTVDDEGSVGVVVFVSPSLAGEAALAAQVIEVSQGAVPLVEVLLTPRPSISGASRRKVDVTGLMFWERGSADYMRRVDQVVRALM